MEKTRSGDTREDAVVRSDDRVKAACMVTRSLLCRLGMALVQLDLPAARAQALAYRGAGDACANHGRLSVFYGNRSVLIPDVSRGEHFPLVAEAGALLDRKS